MCWKCILKVVVIFTSALLLGVNGVRYRDTQFAERNLQETIPKIGLPVAIDQDWMGSVTLWNFAYMSKQHIIRIASSLLQRERLDPTLLAHKACMIFTPGNGSVNGFGGTESQDFLVNFIPGAIQFTLPCTHPDACSSRVLARYNYRLTDNSTYVLGIVSWQDRYVTWLTLATTPQLSETAQADVLSYITSIDLDPAYAIANIGDKCGPY